MATMNLSSASRPGNAPIERPAEKGYYCQTCKEGTRRGVNGGWYHVQPVTICRDLRPSRWEWDLMTPWSKTMVAIGEDCDAGVNHRR